MNYFDVTSVGLSNLDHTLFYSMHMKKKFYFVTYLILFIIGFELLNSANILDMESASRSETFSKFLVMIIVLISVTRWGIRLYVRLTGYECNPTTNNKKHIN